MKVAPYSLAASLVIGVMGAWAWAYHPAGAQAVIVSPTQGKSATIAAGEVVKFVAEVEGTAAGTPVSVIWRGPDNRELSVSTSWLKEGDKSLAFTAENTAAWEPGQYRAELWVADRKVLQERFGIEAHPRK